MGEKLKKKEDNNTTLNNSANVKYGRNTCKEGGQSILKGNIILEN